MAACWAVASSQFERAPGMATERLESAFDIISTKSSKLTPLIVAAGRPMMIAKSNAEKKSYVIGPARSDAKNFGSNGIGHAGNDSTTAPRLYPSLTSAQ